MSAMGDMQLAGKKALVLGLGETGFSMARWLSRCGAGVRVADSRAAPPNADALARELPAAELHAGPWQDAAFAGIDLIAISPGIAPTEPLVQAAAARGVPVVGDIELFVRALRDPVLWSRRARDFTPPKILAVTGTNGKTTVTALAGAMCHRAGTACEVAGNIGPAALDALMACVDARRMPELWVLELSSFQLETTHTLAASAAAVLNVSEDHLDRHDGMAAYAAAKARIFDGEGVQVLNRADPLVMAMARRGRRQYTFGTDAPRGLDDFGLLESHGRPCLAQGTTPLIPMADMALSGLHNAANALAALALCRAIDLPYTPLLAAIEDFAGLPHRVERVAEHDGVAFYDDSKGTNVGATVAAIAGLTGASASGRGQHQKIVLIAGGDGKGQDFSPLREAVARGARSVVLIGRDAARIEQAVAESGVPVMRAGSMEEAVETAFRMAKPGDAVLLSPACASFDMFDNYKHRGEVFAAAARRMAHVQPQ
jgi:UDP-N-acetylmuramoylalanine--D-glutamate ligase